MRWLAGLALAASFFIPVTGLGIDVCPVHRLTGLPCAGCGLTRAVALVSQGDPLTALGANPFVLVAWPLIVALGLSALLPARVVNAWGARLARHERRLNQLYRVVLFAFAGFGVLRFLVFLALWQPFP